MKCKYSAVVLGASTGGVEACGKILSDLPELFELPIIITQHISSHSDSYMVKYFDRICKIAVKEVDEKEKIKPGNIYVAPPNYHLLVEKDETFSLTVEKKVNYARPSIDVLFETAADTYGDRLIGIILTGANKDGSMGLKRIKECGGIAIIQDPKTALADTMPRTAITEVNADYIIPLNDIALKLVELTKESHCELEGKYKNINC